MPGKIKIRYVRSAIGRGKKQRDTVRCLGLTRLHQVRELEDTTCVRGMVRKVCDLVEIVHVVE